jgi:hypothetical protein
MNYNGPWTQDEDEKLLHYVKAGETGWSALQQFFPGRNSTRIKNRAHQLQRRENRDAKLGMSDGSSSRQNDWDIFSDHGENDELDDWYIFCDMEQFTDGWSLFPSSLSK